ncbi:MULTISPECIES: dephospho-CoA kinase [Terrabacteria group]|uniref:dephospho-CoA kinase n=1 Tax=Bacillati TaxID=1783272 RepID=UPI001C6E8F8C|nr:MULTISPECIES: dephospho-CoA kinase [Terrabacteria group]MBW9212031.1 dephospho-CoA kinase [Trueperella sp. zg.1013]
MKKVGITGTIAAGKSTVAKILRLKGFPVFNADQYAHLVYLPKSEVYENLLRVLGEDVFDAFKQINKQKVAQKIFKDDILKKEVEAIIHPFVKEGMLKFFTRNQEKDLLFAEVPLLYQAGWQDCFDYVMIVDASKEEVIKRMIQERHYTKEEANQRYLLQKQAFPKNETTIYIQNNGRKEDLVHQVNKVLRKLRKESYGDSTPTKF